LIRALKSNTLGASTGESRSITGDKTMSGTKKAKEDTTKQTGADEADTEGQSLWINPGSASDLSRVRQQEQERQLRARKREKEARGR
jgi:hypothetical protein